VTHCSALLLLSALCMLLVSPTSRAAAAGTARLGAEQGGYMDATGSETAHRYLEQAGELKCDLMVLNETSGFTRGPVPGEATEEIGAIAKKYGMHIVGMQSEPPNYTTTWLLDPEDGFVGKYHMNHYHTQVEPEPWPVFETKLGKVGIPICMDNHFPESARSLALNGAEIITLSTAPWSWEGPYLFELQQRGAALMNGVYMVIASDGWLWTAARGSTVPKDPCDPRHILGYACGVDCQSMVIDPSGRILARSNRNNGVVYADVDLGYKYRTTGIGIQGTGVLRDIIFSHRRPDTYRAIVDKDGRISSVLACPFKAAAIQWGKDESLQAKTFEQQLALMAKYLDQAGTARADIAVMPEGWCGWQARPLEQGPIFDLARKKAAQYAMGVVLWQIEEADGKHYNTSCFINRAGELAATYRKVHLDWQDEAAGVTAGATYPTVTVDFAASGMLIGLDNMIFEAGRCLYLEGAYLVMSPISTLGNLGRERFELAMGLQAYQNGQFIVAALNSGPDSDAVAAIFDMGGHVLARGYGSDGPVFGVFNTGDIDEYRKWVCTNRRPEVYHRLVETEKR
jgi:predicted amidohydrolase